jgi:hypothetical protein
MPHLHGVAARRPTRVHCRSATGCTAAACRSCGPTSSRTSTGDVRPIIEELWAGAPDAVLCRGNWMRTRRLRELPDRSIVYHIDRAIAAEPPHAA